MALGRARRGLSPPGAVKRLKNSPHRPKEVSVFKCLFVSKHETGRGNAACQSSDIKTWDTLDIDLQICPELDHVDGVEGGGGGGLSGWSLAQTGSGLGL